jgi:2-phosphosulfolactate phosphatase
MKPGRHFQCAFTVRAKRARVFDNRAGHLYFGVQPTKSPGLDGEEDVFYQQEGYTLRFDWGVEGLQALLPVSDVIVIVDVLSFCSAVDIAAGRGAWVYPASRHDSQAEELARAVGGIVAVKAAAQGGYSLAPSSLLEIPAGTRLILPSLNGATLSRQTAATPTLAGCLRNAGAVARAARRLGSHISVIAAGERWPDGGLRPALEDFLGAGAILAGLDGPLSPEAQSAIAAFQGLRQQLAASLMACASGREQVERGRMRDVDLAAALNASECAPMLQDGAFLASIPG